MSDMPIFRLSRRGYLAVELMPEYRGKKAENAIKRITEKGECNNKKELSAMLAANAADFPDPKFPEKESP